MRTGPSGMLPPKLTWRLHPDDAPILARALWKLAEIFFAAGAPARSTHSRMAISELSLDLRPSFTIRV